MNLDDYILAVIEHKCNSRCSMCFIEDNKEDLADLRKIPFSHFKKFLKLIPNKYSGILFSGGEASLNKQLPEYASYAREHGFQNIMIQTNARVLSDIRKAKELKSAGINHYFVSFHSADNDLSDTITGIKGAHAQTLKGLENLNELNLAVYTNTVMSSLNYSVIPEVGEFLLRFGNIKQMNFWGYKPVTIKKTELMLPYGLSAPYLNKTIGYLEKHHMDISVQFYPLCLLDAPFQKYYSTRQPANLGMIDKFMERKWEICKFEHYSCCKGTHCWGVPDIYTKTSSEESWKPMSPKLN